MDIYLICWKDAFSTDRWLNKIEMLQWVYEGFEINSVGYLIHEDENYITLAENIQENSEYFSGLINIPHSCITKKIKLKDPEKKDFK